MPASKYVRPTVWVPPVVSPVLQPQPPLAPSIPPAHVVDLMTEAGSAALGARWRVKEAKIVECPALTNSLPEFKTTYDIEPHAEMLGFDDSDWAVIPPADLGVRRGGGLVSFIWFRTILTIPANVAGFDCAGAKAVFRVNVDDYAEVWINGTMLRTPRPAEPGGDPGLQHAQPRGAHRWSRVSGRPVRDRRVCDQRADLGGAGELPLLPRSEARVFPVSSSD